MGNGLSEVMASAVHLRSNAVVIRIFYGSDLARIPSDPVKESCSPVGILMWYTPGIGRCSIVKLDASFEPVLFVREHYNSG